MFKTVTGQGDAVAAKMASTFKALATKADWSEVAGGSPPPGEPASGGADNGVDGGNGSPQEPGRVSLHHDVHIHLPATSDVAVYRAIFRALKDELM